MGASEFSELKLLLLGGKSHGMAMLRAVLTIIGVSRVSLVEDARRALDMLCAENFDAVFFDLTAAPVDGMPFAVAARRSSAAVNPLIPLFLLQDHVRRREVELARDLGASDVLTCPLSPKTVMTKLRAALTTPRAFIAAPAFFGPDRRTVARGFFGGADRRVQPARKVRLQKPVGSDKPAPP